MVEHSDDESLDGILQNSTLSDDFEGDDISFAPHHHSSRHPAQAHSNGSHLTIEDIRLRLEGRKPQRPGVLHYSTGASESGNLETGALTRLHSRSKSVADEGVRLERDAQKFIDVLEALMELSSLLSNDRDDAITEASRIRTSVRQLEELVDSRTDRELQYLSQVQHQQNARFEKKYRTLALRARHHIAETQQQAGLYHTKCQKKLRRAQGVQDEFDYLSRIMQAQKQELDALKEATKNRISERDLTEIRIRFLRLQDENSKLQMEKAKLYQLVDEAQQQLNKHKSEKTLSLSTYFEIERTIQFPNFSESQMTEQETYVSRMAELEQAIAKSQEEKAQQAAEHKAKKSSMEMESKRIQEYAIYLVNALEKGQNP